MKDLYTREKDEVDSLSNLLCDFLRFGDQEVTTSNLPWEREFWEMKMNSLSTTLYGGFRRQNWIKRNTGASTFDWILVVRIYYQ